MCGVPGGGGHLAGPMHIQRRRCEAGCCWGMCGGEILIVGVAVMSSKAILVEMFAMAK